MPSYLIKSGTIPFTGAELCDDLEISAAFAVTLDDMIAVECCNSARPVLASVWRISDDDGFERRCLHGGQRPAKISEPFHYLGETYRDCTYVPNPDAVAVVRAAVIGKAMSGDHIGLARAILAEVV